MMRNAFVLLSMCFLCFDSVLHAEPIAQEDVYLRIETINASTGEGDANAKIDKRLKKISWKLENLPYKNFELKSSQKVQVPLKKKQIVRLPNGQELTLRLLYKNDTRLGIWINWLDKSGMQLLNSKIHLGCTDPMVAGTDNTDGSASLLAIALESN